MAAIPDLSSASSIAATDYFVVNQSGTDRKALANKLPLLTVANTFTTDQTINGELNLRQHTTSELWSIDVANGTPVVAANGAVFQFSDASAFSGMVCVVNTTDGAIALFLCGGGQVGEVSDPSNVYSKTKDTASSTNVYFDGATSEYRMQNNTGGSRTYNIFSVRLRASS